MFFLIFITAAIPLVMCQKIIMKEFQNETYYFEVKKLANYKEAKKYCTKMHASLLRISNREMDKFVGETLRITDINPPHLFYIGMDEPIPSGPRTSIDGSKTIDTGHRSKNGYSFRTQSCAAISIPSSSLDQYPTTLLTHRCDKKLHYICQQIGISTNSFFQNNMSTETSDFDNVSITAVKSYMETSTVIAHPTSAAWFLILTVISSIIVISSLLLLCFLQKKNRRTTAILPSATENFGMPEGTGPSELMATAGSSFARIASSNSGLYHSEA